MRKIILKNHVLKNIFIGQVFFCKATYLIDGMAGSYAKLYWKNSENEAIREFIGFTWSSNQTITCSIYLQ
jgi:hypothetical protein